MTTVREHFEWVTIGPVSWEKGLEIVRIERPNYDPETDETLRAFPAVCKRNSAGRRPIYDEMTADMRANGMDVQVHGTAAAWVPRLRGMGIIAERA